jgi:hypothetical protein
MSRGKFVICSPPFPVYSLSEEAAMEIQQASNLGLLQRTLKIKPDARITMRLTSEGADVWDLSTGNIYRVTPGNVSVEMHAVPPDVLEIIAASDETLRKHLRDTWQQGWTEERQTMFTELVFRGVDVINL